MKIIHFADVHVSRENKEKAFMSLETLIETGREEKIDLYVCSGDMFDRALNNTTSSGLPELEQLIKQMLDIAPVVVVEGTPTHDLPGCYDIFQDILATHNFTILRPGIKYFLEDSLVSDNMDNSPKPDLLILGIPEPTKEQFLKDRQMGKEESNEVIKEGMQALLLGLAAIRRQYPDIPCIQLYHGAIAGSSIHDHQVLPAGGIQIGRDDLALVGADYYALGHIHKAQQIGDLPAYYAGSAFAVDWGEQDKKGFNLVKIAPFGNQGRFSTRIDLLDYPHVPRKKIVTDLMGLPSVMNRVETSVKGFDVWLQIKVEREKRGAVDIKEIGDKLKAAGAELGTFVELVVKPTETVRSAAIKDTPHLRDKVKIHGALSGKEVEESILEKADELEATAKAEGLTAEGLHIRIKKLILRGAIGIQKGTGNDQVEVDFDRYDPGLIALIGVNGAGKTTLIENMHPYPQMLTRQGKLQDHFCLRDSFRDLYFVDENTGVEYRAFMQIDGVNKSGSVEYFLYYHDNNLHGNGSTWVPCSSEINGRLAPYVAEIQRLFGSMQLFLRSAFVSQKQPKNLPDLSEATPGERKALFRELGGLDYLQAYSDSAKEKEKALDRELIGDKAKIESLGEQTASLPDKKSELLLMEATKGNFESRLKEIADKGKKLKGEAEALVEKVEKNKELRTTIDNADNEIRSYRGEIEQLRVNVEEYETALKGKAEKEEQLIKLENLKNREAKLNEEQTKIFKEREAVLSKYQNDKAAVVNAERALRDNKAAVEKEVAEIKRQIDVLGVKRDKLEEELKSPITENCPTCGQKWPKDRLEEFKEQTKSKQRDLLSLTEKIETDLEILLKNRYEKIGTIDLDIERLEWPKEPELPAFNVDVLNDVRNQIQWMDENVIRQELDKAKEAGIRIEEISSRLELLEKQVENITDRKNELMDQVDEKADAAYKDITVSLDVTRERYAEADKELTRVKTEISGLEKLIQDTEAKVKELKGLKGAVKGKETDRQQWEYLQRACGPDGIQALELDAMGPEIADVANSILESAYGSRFQIEFRTTRIGGSGSKTKQIEDFQIIVHDSLYPDINNGEVKLEDLSGGESIWIKRALYDAFGVIRARMTGTQHLTVFADEADGALDQKGAKEQYFKMLERAHTESGRHHTIVITHSPEAQEMIGQKIEMSTLKESIKEEVAV